jgi:hypothetical protein
MQSCRAGWIWRGSLLLLQIAGDMWYDNIGLRRTDLKENGTAGNDA